MAGSSSIFPVLLLLTVLASPPTSAIQLSHMTYRDVTTFYTGQERQFDQFSLSVADREFTSFRLRACQEGHILVHATKGINPTAGRSAGQYDSSVIATEVVIASESNSKIIVTDPAKGSTPIATVDADNLLDCNDFRQFWISWRNQTLQLGRGPIYGQQVLVKVSDYSIRFVDVDTLFFSTGNSFTGMWQIEESSGVSSKLLTLPSGSFSSLWRSVLNRPGWFPFSVKAENDAMIALGTRSGVPIYTITLGGFGNTRSVIKKYDKEVAQYVEKNVTDGSRFLPFWVSWDEGLIEVGVGREKSALAIMDYQDSGFLDIGHIGFRTAVNAKGEWLFRETRENEIIVHVPVKPEANSYDFFMTAPRSKFIHFSVEACSEAEIIFSTFVDGVDDNTLHVFLGAKDNTVIVVGTGYTPSIKEFPAPGILNCDLPLPFWASWKLGMLRLGSGSVENKDILMTFEHPTVPLIHSVGFNGKQDVVFYVEGMFGDQMSTVAPAALQFGRAWVTTRQEFFKTFRLEQCGGAQLLLSETIDSVAAGKYTVTFNNDGKSVTLARSVNGVTNQTTSQLPEPLVCSTPRPFWLSWYKNEVRLGEGHLYGQREVLKATWGDPYPINALSIGNKGTEDAVWEVDMDPADLLSVQLPRSSGPQPRWFRVGLDWLYLRLANDGPASVAITSWYRDMTAQLYRLTFGEGGANTCVLRRGQEKVREASITQEWNRRDLRDFWISFGDGTLRVGESRYQGSNELFNAPLNDQVEALAFLPVDGSNIEWQVLHAFGPESTLYTYPGQNDLSWLKVSYHNSLVFGLRACSDAAIYLTGSMYSTSMEPYLVEIGHSGNTMTRVSQGSELQLWTKTPNILSCDEERYFWITWYEGTLGVGQGQEVGQRRLLTWHGQRPHWINAVTMDTTKGEGMWRVGYLGGSLDRRPVVNPPAGGLSGGAIAGIILGVLLAIVVCACVAYVLVRGVPGPVQRALPSRSRRAATDTEHFTNAIRYVGDSYDQQDPAAVPGLEEAPEERADPS